MPRLTQAETQCGILDGMWQQRECQCAFSTHADMYCSMHDDIDISMHIMRCAMHTGMHAPHRWRYVRRPALGLRCLSCLAGVRWLSALLVSSPPTDA